jgi:two-component system, OmpR family, KDP operon response regulator KdpE
LVSPPHSNSNPLRSVMVNEGCEVEEVPVDSPVAAEPARGYCLVLFDLERVTHRLLEVFRAWHDEMPETALVVVGRRMAQATRIAVLETGVTSYLTKPVVIPELSARIRAALRRSRSQESRSRQLPFGVAIIDVEARLFRSPEGDVRLTPTECTILEHLATRMNHTVQPGELVKLLWGDDPQKGVHSLRLFIRKLRRKIEPDPANPVYLITDPTVGYRLQQPAEAPDPVSG